MSEDKFDALEYMDLLGSRPNFIIGVYRNKKRGTYYNARRLAWNANNGMDRWEVVYHRVEDHLRTVLHFRNVSEFLEKFEYVSS